MKIVVGGKTGWLQVKEVTAEHFFYLSTERPTKPKTQTLVEPASQVRQYGMTHLNDIIPSAPIKVYTQLYQE